ncbi:hypothetical protein ABH940_006253 [Streptacidiphilus sp. BW17]|uniref:hypothetical protein n=1 Tax=Streptacidiphilus sp. BW17 TaxID=3156274 RepID=UPI00351516BC
MKMPVPTIPFAARGAMLPVLVDLEPEHPAYDSVRQINVLADGTAWHLTPQAGSSTDTNWDSSPDDVQDPYMAQAA